MDIWTVSIFWSSCIKLPWKLAYKYLFEYLLSILWGIYLVELLDNMVILWLTFWGTDKLCSHTTCTILRTHQEGTTLTILPRPCCMIRLFKVAVPLPDQCLLHLQAILLTDLPTYLPQTLANDWFNFSCHDSLLKGRWEACPFAGFPGNQWPNQMSIPLINSTRPPPPPFSRSLFPCPACLLQDLAPGIWVSPFMKLLMSLSLTLGSFFSHRIGKYRVWRLVGAAQQLAEPARRWRKLLWVLRYWLGNGKFWGLFTNIWGQKLCGKSVYQRVGSCGVCPWWMRTSKGVLRTHRQPLRPLQKHWLAFWLRGKCGPSCGLAITLYIKKGHRGWANSWGKD